MNVSNVLKLPRAYFCIDSSQSTVTIFATPLTSYASRAQHRMNGKGRRSQQIQMYTTLQLLCKRKICNKNCQNYIYFLSPKSNKLNNFPEKICSAHNWYCHNICHENSGAVRSPIRSLTWLSLARENVKGWAPQNSHSCDAAKVKFVGRTLFTVLTPIRPVDPDRIREKFFRLWLGDAVTKLFNVLAV